MIKGTRFVQHDGPIPDDYRIIDEDDYSTDYRAYISGDITSDVAFIILRFFQDENWWPKGIDKKATLSFDFDYSPFMTALGAHMKGSCMRRLYIVPKLK